MIGLLDLRWSKCNLSVKTNRNKDLLNAHWIALSVERSHLLVDIHLLFIIFYFIALKVIFRYNGDIALK